MGESERWAAPQPGNLGSIFYSSPSQEAGRLDGGFLRRE